MSNSTLQSPKQRPSRATALRRRAKTQQGVAFRKTTARLEGRRDGTPLVFGWGRHLTRAQKSHYQRVAAYSFFGAVTVLVIGVFVFGLLQQNVFIPNQALFSVNGVNVSQDTYRKQMAYDAQDLWNQMQANIKLHDQLTDKQSKGDTSSQTATALQLATSTVEAEEGNYSQSSITQSTADQLVEDQLIQQQAVRFAQTDKSAKQKLTPTTAQIDAKINAFKKAFPSNEKYSDFVAKNGMSDDDVRAAATVLVRRDLMQSYLAATYVSPAPAAHLRVIERSTQADAQKTLAELQKDKLTSMSANWNDIAKKESLDNDSKNSGGDMGWILRGGNDSGVELWVYDPSTKVGDVQIVQTVNGTFDVIQLLSIDPNHVVDADSLKNWQNNALPHAISGWRVAPYNKLDKPNPDMLTASRNMPALPDPNAQLPNYNPQQQQGTQS